MVRPLLTSPDAFYSALIEQFGDDVQVNEPIAKHTSARIGGPADLFLTVHNANELERAAHLAWQHDAPLTVIGGGSNILISDAGVDGLVLNNKANRVRFTGRLCLAESGVSTIKLARACAERGLSGFEWGIGVPGTLGGAAYGNAGAHGRDMNSCVVFVYGATPSQPQAIWSNEDMAYTYRSSFLKQTQVPAIISNILIELEPESPIEIKKRMEEYNSYRKQTQPPGATIGSMFKNPEGDYAGRLIEASGLKGHTIGGAQISAKHANFFLNVNDATAWDVYRLAEHARQIVERDHNVTLELEIERIGRWD